MDLPVLLGNLQFSDQFKLLQNACKQIFRDPSQSNLDYLNSLCSTFDPNILGNFLRYIIIPLGAQLQRTDTISCRVIGCLIKLLEKSIVTDLIIFLNIYGLIVRQIQDLNSPVVRQSSEELKLAVLKCITQLIKSSTSDVRQRFMSRKYYSKLSIGVFLCAEIAKNEKYVVLKVEALNSLLFLTHVTDELTCSEGFRKDLAQVIMLMVPGVCSACYNIVNNDEVQNHKSVVLALRLWYRLLGTVLSVEVSEKNQTKFKLVETEEKSNCTEDSNDYPDNCNEELLIKLKTTKLDKEWIKSTDKHLVNVTKMMVTCKRHYHWSVRHELSKAAYHLLNECGLNFVESVGYLVEALIFLTQDENNIVAECSQKFINQLAHKCNDRLVDIVEDNFYFLLTRLPRIFHGADITLKEEQLTLVCGFLDILGPEHVPVIFYSSQHLERFLHSLMICATPDCSGIALLEEIGFLALNSYCDQPKWRRLKHCDTEKCEEMLKNVCSKLVEYSDLEVLLNTLLDKFNAGNVYKNNILVLFVLLFSSGSSKKFQSLSSILKDIVITLTESISSWSVPISIENNSTEKVVMQEHIVEICLIVETIGCISEAAGLAVFSPLLLHCLYPILECSGSPIRFISDAGNASLRKLAKLYPDGNVSTLITNNADYLSHHVMLKLRRPEQNPRILSVLSIIMDHFSYNTLPCLHDLINDVLLQSPCMFQRTKETPFLHVFKTYLQCIIKWMKPCEKTSNLQIAVKGSLIKELLKYKEALIAADVKEYDEQTPENYTDFMQMMDAEEYQVEKEEAKEANVPDHIKLTQDILLSCLHFLPNNDLSRLVLVLEIMADGVVILSNWPDILLPVVHKIWSPFVERFKTSNNALVLDRAFSLLKVIARYSRDFIRARTFKEVLPHLCKVLKENCRRKKKEGFSDALIFTQLFKFQQNLLSGLGTLVIDLEALPKQLCPLLDAASPYLSSKQPSLLREKCLEFFMRIGEKYPDLVWLHLMSIYPIPVELKAPCEGLNDYKFESHLQNKEEYMSAVEQLLSCI